MKLFVAVLSTALFTLGSLASASPKGLSPEGQKASAPDIAINSKGDIAVLWVDRSPQEKPADGAHNHDRHLAVTDVHVTISKDGGNTFSAPTKVNASAATFDDHRPRYEWSDSWRICKRCCVQHHDFGTGWQYIT